VSKISTPASGFLFPSQTAMQNLVSLSTNKSFSLRKTPDILKYAMRNLAGLPVFTTISLASSLFSRGMLGNQLFRKRIIKFRRLGIIDMVGVLV